MLEGENNPLGKETEYKSIYDPSLLFSIKRDLGRANIGISDPELGEKGSVDLPFSGFDVWNCYELSWLDNYGKPQLAILKFFVPCQSPNIVESKSVKLYLNSFNNTKFAGISEVERHVKQDLSKATDSEVVVEIKNLEEFSGSKLSEPKGQNIDNIEIQVNDYDLSADYLKLAGGDQENQNIDEVLYSNLLRSNCLITNQPDWGSVSISYSGAKIDKESLLRYIISFRNHNEFHEQCVERIFCDIMKKCSPDSLTVEAKYTRRGGIDINPIRSTGEIHPQNIDSSRLPRQ